jgi:adenylosuccinate lyase
MLENLNVGGGLVFSQGVLLALVDSGLSRDESYKMVQAAAAGAWDDGGNFKEAIRNAAGDRIPDLDALFDPGGSLSNLGEVFERVEQLEVSG